MSAAGDASVRSNQSGMRPASPSVGVSDLTVIPIPCAENLKGLSPEALAAAMAELASTMAKKEDPGTRAEAIDMEGISVRLAEAFGSICSANADNGTKAYVVGGESAASGHQHQNTERLSLAGSAASNAFDEMIDALGSSRPTSPLMLPTLMESQQRGLKDADSSPDKCVKAPVAAVDIGDCTRISVGSDMGRCTYNDCPRSASVSRFCPQHFGTTEGIRYSPTPLRPSPLGGAKGPLAEILAKAPSEMPDKKDKPHRTASVPTFASRQDAPQEIADVFVRGDSMNGLITEASSVDLGGVVSSPLYKSGEASFSLPPNIVRSKPPRSPDPIVRKSVGSPALNSPLSRPNTAELASSHSSSSLVKLTHKNPTRTKSREVVSRAGSVSGNPLVRVSKSHPSLYEVAYQLTGETGSCLCESCHEPGRGRCASPCFPSVEG